MRFSFILICLFIYSAISGQSLIANGSFEDRNVCTEFQVECEPEAWLSDGNINFDYYKDDKARAHTGECLMAITASHATKKFFRSQIGTQLICGLKKGNKYRFEIYVKSPHPVLDSIGVYFTTYSVVFEEEPTHKIKPAFHLSDANTFDKKDTNWQKATIDYTATGEELFLMIAYFSDKDYKGPTVSKIENFYYAYIDDVSLTPLDPNEHICDNWKQAIKDIYDFDPRHEFLSRWIGAHWNNPPKPQLTKTSTIIIDTLVMSDVLFETGKADLSKESFTLLDSVCQIIRSKKLDSIIVQGHTDTVGTLESNQQLSANRAAAVKDYLSSKTGYQAIVTRGYAFLRPVAPNTDAEGRRRNRRVEILLYIRE